MDVRCERVNKTTLSNYSHEYTYDAREWTHACHAMHDVRAPECGLEVLQRRVRGASPTLSGSHAFRQARSRKSASKSCISPFGFGFHICKTQSIIPAVRSQRQAEYLFKSKKKIMNLCSSHAFVYFNYLFKSKKKITM